MGVFKDLSQITLHFSQCQGIPVYNSEEKVIGKLSDFFVDYEDVFPEVIAVQFKRNRQHFYVSWEHIVEFSYSAIRLSESSFIGHSRTYPKANKDKVITTIAGGQFNRDTQEYPPLGKIVLDKQIVDTSGKKVVRVNDIHMIRSGDNLRVTHAAIGLRSMMRRLGYEKVIDGIVKLIRPKAKYLTTETLINWKYVHAIPNKNIQSSVKLNLTNEDIKGLHPADLADILEDLDNYGRELIFSNLDPKTQAETLQEVEHDVQRNLIQNETPEDAAKIIENMDTDDAADLLGEMSHDKAGEILSKIQDDEIQEEIQELLEYDEDTAGGLMSTEVFEIKKSETKSTILKRIQDENEELETIYDLYVIDSENKLIGTCELRDLLIQKEDVEIASIMNRDDIKTIKPTQKWKDIAHLMNKYNLINVPITGDENELLGVVSVDDVLPWLLHEK